MRNLFIIASVMLLLAASAFGQTSNATLSGTVADVQGGVLPSVTVTATNTSTAVVTTRITNNAGVYSFPSLLPGVYTVSAELSGFQNYTYTDVQLGNAAQVRLNFSLQVGGIESSVEVSVEAEALLLESSSSVGDVLVERTVHELPRVNNNVLDLVRVMGGANLTGDAIFGEVGFGPGGDTTFAGVSSGNINVQRDGVPIQDVRWWTGVNSPTRLNPDLVGEFRMVLAPVDAEVGRGNGQIQIQTKSGTNEYHGNAVWNVQNTALDPNTWDNNRSGIDPDWRNLHEYTISVGGPIIKNKTFFFALFNGQINRIREPWNVLSLTPCAQKGIFRYFDNWNNGNVFSPTTGGFTPTTPVVDAAGNPLAPATNPDGTPHNGILRYASVFGPLRDGISLNGDCSNFNPATDIVGAPWDTYRTAVDSTGYITNFLSIMPQPNNYEIGDGLNTAGHRWNRTLRGANNLYGVGEDTQRKQINIRIDHNFSDYHRISGTWSFEKNWADDSFVNWPENAYGGRHETQPQVLAINFTSTISPTLLNEARIGMSRTGTNVFTPLSNPETGHLMREMLPEVSGAPYVVGPGQGAVLFGPEAGFGAPAGTPSNPYGGRGLVIGDLIDSSPRWSFADTISWTKGAHSLKGGAEFRWSSSYGEQSWTFGPGGSYNPTPYAAGGVTPFAAVQGINGINMPGMAGSTFSGNVSAMEDLLVFLSGSLSALRQRYYINSPDQTTWSNPLEEPAPIRDYRQYEFAAFFKDDWKVHPDLTLNLGLRYEYYGVPFIKNGMTAGFEGGGAALFGISGRSFQEAFWKPGERADLTDLIFIGPDSPNTDQRSYERDLNNFGPAVGFAWQFPWLGKGRTTIRGGYQMSYLTSGRAADVIAVIGSPPGSSYTDSYSGDADTPYLDLTDLVNPVPISSGIEPMESIPLTDRSVSIEGFDPNLRTPYIQNLTLAIQRNVTSNLMVELKYVATLSRKLIGDHNINQPNFLTNGLLEAFNAARIGDDDNPDLQILDDMLSGINLAGEGYGPIGTDFEGVPQTAALHLRNSTVIAVPISFSQIRTDLANGDYAALAQKLNFLGYPAGEYLRGSGLFPENFVKTNPQFNNATFRTNSGHANYHSLQAQVTLRPTHGLSLQGTYTWSRNLGVTGDPTNPLNRAADYTLIGGNRSHAFVTYGTYDLPFGPGKLVGGDTSGWLARLIEGWQGSWIANVNSGQPMSIQAANMLYANGVPDLVGPFDPDSVGTVWEHGANEGNYFGSRYTTVSDPQCSTIHASLQPYCSLQAVQGSGGQIIFQNPQPGMQGTLGRNSIYGPGTWNIDMAIAKSIEIMEEKRISFRIDAANIFNHPQPSLGQFNSGIRITAANPPDLNINSGNPFGYLNNKVGTRTFQLMIRFSF